jgi:RNA polymerase sigma-70 factor (ECF subfamily)
MVRADIVDRSYTGTEQIEGLVSAARVGDLAAYEELYRMFVDRIYAFALWTGGSHEAADEITQRTFVRAWEKLGQFAGRSAFLTWLTSIAANIAKERRRTLHRRSSREAPDEGNALAAARAPTGTFAAEEVMDLRVAIARLPRRARMVLVLHEIQGLTHAEVAEAMGITPGASKAQLNRARRLLKEDLSR